MCLTLCIQEKSIKTSTFANSEDPDGSTLFVKVKKIFREKNTIFL